MSASPKKLYLDIGGQKDRSQAPEWLIVDIRKGADVRVDLCQQLIPLKSNSVDLIYCSHTLEHIFKDKIESVLCEFYRILKPNGTLRIVVPDLEKISQAYINKDIEFFKAWPPSRKRLESGMPLGMVVSYLIATGMLSRFYNKTGQGHVNMYDYDALKYLLNLIGFENTLQKDFLTTDCNPFLAAEKNTPSLNAPEGNIQNASLYLETQKPAIHNTASLSLIMIYGINFCLKLLKTISPSKSITIHNLLTKGLTRWPVAKEKFRKQWFKLMTS